MKHAQHDERMEDELFFGQQEKNRNSKIEISLMFEDEN